jgi:hypothetical protein
MYQLILAIAVMVKCGVIFSTDRTLKYYLEDLQLETRKRLDGPATGQLSQGFQ